MRRLLLALMLAIGASAQAADRQIIEAVAPHFTLYSALPENETRQYAASLDTLYRLLAAATGNDKPKSAGPLHFYLLSRADAEHFVGGGEWSNPYWNAPGPLVETEPWVTTGPFDVDILLPMAGSHGEPYGYVMDALGRYVAITHCAPGCQPWFDEALTQFAAGALVYPDRIEIYPRYAHWLPAPKWMEPDEFFGTHYDDIAYLERRMPVGFGAQAWLLMHYAYLQNREVLRKIGVYAARINEGVSPATALAALRSGGDVDMAGGLAEYAKQPAFTNAVIHPQPLPNSDLHVRKLDAAAAAHVLTELAFHISILGKRKAMFNRVSRGLPDDPWLLVYAVQMEMESSGSKKAKVERLASFEQRIEALGQPYDAEVPAGLAEAHLTLGAPDAWDYEPHVEDAAEVRLARAAFERALKLDPDHVESLVGYALTCRLLGDCLEGAAAHLRHAVEIAPLSWGVVGEQAELLQVLGKQDEADGYWYVLARIAPNQSFRRYALHHTRAYARKVLVVP